MGDDVEIRERLTRLEERLAALDKKVCDATSVLTELNETLQKAKGAKWLLGTLLALVAGTVAFTIKFTAFLTWLGFSPR